MAGRDAGGRAVEDFVVLRLDLAAQFVIRFLHHVEDSVDKLCLASFAEAVGDVEGEVVAVAIREGSNECSGLLEVICVAALPFVSKIRSAIASQWWLLHYLLLRR